MGSYGGKVTNGRKKWTVMVYFAADNDLDKYAPENLKQMKKAGSTNEINLIAEANYPGQAPRRYYLRNESESQLEQDQLPTKLAERNTGDPRYLIEFIDWASQYPADHYLLVLWGHGQGWNDDVTSIVEDIFGKDIANKFDDKFNAFPEGGFGDLTQQDFLTNDEMQYALSEGVKKLGGKIDILGMDACLMNMLEVCYEVRDSVVYSVASEDLSPDEGWPYDKILARLVAEPGMDPERFASAIVEEYVKHYRAIKEQEKDKKDEEKRLRRDVMLSACDLRLSEKLARGVWSLGDALSEGLTDHFTKGIIMLARRMARAYFVQDYIDLCNFCEILAELLVKTEADEDLRSACVNVSAAIRKSRFVVASDSTEYPASTAKSAAQESPALRPTNGVSIYLPWIPPSYNDLDLVQDSHWDDFLNEYLNQSLITQWRRKAPVASAAKTKETADRKEADTMSRFKSPYGKDRYPYDGSRFAESIFNMILDLQQGKRRQPSGDGEDDYRYPYDGSRAMELLQDLVEELQRSSSRRPSRSSQPSGFDDAVYEVRVRRIRD